MDWWFSSETLYLNVLQVQGIDFPPKFSFLHILPRIVRAIPQSFISAHLWHGQTAESRGWSDTNSGSWQPTALVANGNKRGRQGVFSFFISFSPPPVLGRTGLDNKAKPVQWPVPRVTLQCHVQLLVQIWWVTNCSRWALQGWEA